LRQDGAGQQAAAAAAAAAATAETAVRGVSLGVAGKEMLQARNAQAAQ
jgi:hypothetical protein